MSQLGHRMKDPNSDIIGPIMFTGTPVRKDNTIHFDTKEILGFTLLPSNKITIDIALFRLYNTGA